ncbi:MAG: hypothetical protein LC100_00505 [Chitinophagales bacterium]|nr:hypothetical protein [Chitinophagales bacterium]
MAILFMEQNVIYEKISDILKILEGLSYSEANWIIDLTVASLDKNSVVAINGTPVIATVLP